MTPIGVPRPCPRRGSVSPSLPRRCLPGSRVAQRGEWTPQIVSAIDERTGGGEQELGEAFLQVLQKRGIFLGRLMECHAGSKKKAVPCPHGHSVTYASKRSRRKEPAPSNRASRNLTHVVRFVLECGRTRVLEPEPDCLLDEEGTRGLVSYSRCCDEVIRRAV